MAHNVEQWALPIRVMSGRCVAPCRYADHEMTANQSQCNCVGKKKHLPVICTFEHAFIVFGLQFLLGIGTMNRLYFNMLLLPCFGGFFWFRLYQRLTAVSSMEIAPFGLPRIMKYIAVLYA